MNKSSSPEPRASTNESSVLFSLEELLDLENERIAEEAATKEASLRAEQAERRRRLRLEREKEEERVAALVEAQRRREMREREASARLEAVRLAAIERARLEVEATARQRLLAEAQVHERQLLALNQDRAKKKLGWLAAGSAVFACVLLAGGAVWTNEARKSAQAERMRLTEDLASRQAVAAAEIRRLTAQLEEAGHAERRESELIEKPRHERDASVQPNSKENRTTTPAQGKGSKGTKAPPTPPPKEKDVCPLGDPMCETLE